MEAVAPAGENSELRLRFLRVRRLVEKPSADLERLVGADDQGVRPARGDNAGLRLGERQRDLGPAPPAATSGASTARSSIFAGIASKATPAERRSPIRVLLPEARMIAAMAGLSAPPGRGRATVAAP